MPMLFKPHYDKQSWLCSSAITKVFSWLLKMYERVPYFGCSVVNRSSHQQKDFWPNTAYFPNYQSRFLLWDETSACGI